MIRMLILLGCLSLVAQAKPSEPRSLTITTWNIEHLGSEGRGFGGSFGGYGPYSLPRRFSELPLRTPEQLEAIAQFIRSELQSDVLALQEIAITSRRSGRSRSTQLDAIVEALEQDGGDWCYYLPSVEEIAEGHENLYPAFLWNRERLRLEEVFGLSLMNYELAGKEILDRAPLVGYFEAVSENPETGTDFVLVNVHLASGQHHDENHLIAMTLVEYELSRQLTRHGVTESDRIILGDFNDNPFASKDGIAPKYSPALYAHMKFKGYTDIVNAEVGATRMNSRLDSIIDHVLVNESATRHLTDLAVSVFRPDADVPSRRVLPDWRLTYSDHFPVSFQLVAESRDDDADYFE